MLLREWDGNNHHPLLAKNGPAGLYLDPKYTSWEPSVITGRGNREVSLVRTADTDTVAIGIERDEC